MGRRPRRAGASRAMPSGTSLTTWSARTTHTCTSGSRLSGASHYRVDPVEGLMGQDWLICVPAVSPRPLPQPPKLPERRSAAPRWPRRRRSEPQRSPAALGGGHPVPGGPVVPHFLDEVGQHIGRRQRLPVRQLSGTSSSGSPRSRPGWRSGPSGGCLRPRSSRLLPLVLVLIPPLPERLRRRRLDVTGAEPAARQGHRPPSARDTGP